MGPKSAEEQSVNGTDNKDKRAGGNSSAHVQLVIMETKRIGPMLRPQSPITRHGESMARDSGGILKC